MKIDVNIDRLKKEMRAAVKRGDVLLDDVLFDIAADTHGNAVQGIAKGPATGRIYEKYNPRRTHQASAPGEYPMTDLGGLVSSVKMEQEGKVYRVGTGLMYGKYLEFGTTRMAPRPWLKRSFDRAVDERIKELKRGL